MKNKQEYSREHLLYLRKLKRTNATVHIVRLAVLFLFLILCDHFERNITNGHFSDLK